MKINDVPIIIVNEFKNFQKYNIVYRNDKELLHTEEIDFLTFQELIQDESFKLILESSTMRTWKKVRHQKKSLFDDF